MEHAVTQVLTLLLVAALVGLVARRAAVPYTLALVVAGMGVGLFHFELLQDLHLTPELLLPIFLPALLFEAAWHLDARRFWRDARIILLLAVPGVLVAAAVTGASALGLLRLVGIEAFGPGDAFLLGSLIAATDPISVLALFRSFGVDRRLYLLVEGESLLNDGVAVVLFLIVCAVLGLPTGMGEAPTLHGSAEILVFGVRTFLWMGGAGVVIGAVLGLVASVLTRQVDDRLVEVAITFVLAYGSFLIADHLHASGVLACVASGVVMGSFGSRYGMSANTRVAVGDFWEFMAFFANSFVFLLVGIELDIPELLGHGGLILLVFLAVLFGRLVSVYTMLPLARWMKAEALLPGWAKALVWGGLRGSLSMVLVISLPESYPNRRFLLLLVFGVVSLSLFVQGLSIKPLLTRLGLRVDRRPRLDYERARAVTLMAACASQELRRLSDQGALFPRVGERLVHYYGDRQRLGAERAASLAGDALEADSLQEAALHLLAIEEDALRHAIADGVVSDEAASGLFQDLARRREALRHTESHPEVLEDLLRRVDGA